MKPAINWEFSKIAHRHDAFPNGRHISGGRFFVGLSASLLPNLVGVHAAFGSPQADHMT